MTTANYRKESLFEASGFRVHDSGAERRPVTGGWNRRATENSRLDLQRGCVSLYSLKSLLSQVLLTVSLLSPARPQLWNLLIQCQQLGPSIQMCENMEDIQTTTDVIIKLVDYSIQKTSIPQWIPFFHPHCLIETITFLSPLQAVLEHGINYDTMSSRTQYF